VSEQALRVRGLGRQARQVTDGEVDLAVPHGLDEKLARAQASLRNQVEKHLLSKWADLVYFA
jgi:hypothetical protein